MTLVGSPRCTQTAYSPPSAHWQAPPGTTRSHVAVGAAVGGAAVGCSSGPFVASGTGVGASGTVVLPPSVVTAAPVVVASSSPQATSVTARSATSRSARLTTRPAGAG